MKRTDAQLKEYCRSLSDDQLRFIHMRFHQNYPGDRAEVLEILSKNKIVDRYLAAAATADEFFDCFDRIGELIRQELDRRKPSAPQGGRPPRRREDHNVAVIG